MTKAQKKAFLDELSKIQDKPVSKTLSKLFFQPSNEEVAGLVDALNPAPPAPPPGAAGAPGQEQQAPQNPAAAPAPGPGGA